MLTILLVSLQGPVAAAPTVTSITPSIWGNTSALAISDITGTGFVNGANLTLTPVNVNPLHKGKLTDGTGGATLGQPFCVYVSGNYAYVANALSKSLEIVDISDPANPMHKGNITNGTAGAGGALLYQPHGVYVSGNYAYVVSNSNALEIVDVSDPAHPVHKGNLTDGTGGAALGQPFSVYVSGNYAYIASYGSKALEIVDVSDPANPVHKGNITDGTAGAGGASLNGTYNVQVSGNYAYVASVLSNALEIVDVSDPAHPVHKGSLTDGTGGAVLNAPRGVFKSGNYANVVSVISNSLEIVDVSDPANPVHKGKLADGTGGALLNTPRSVYVSGNYAYIASSGATSKALEIVDVSDPANPVHKGSLTDGTGGAALNQPFSVYVSGNYAYLASYGSNALEIVDLGTIQGTGMTVSSAIHMNGNVNPTGKALGSYNVVITNPDGSFSVLPGGFVLTFPPPPSLVSISPASGSKSTAHAVTVTGLNFNTSGITAYLNLGGVNTSLGAVAGTNTSFTGNVPVNIPAGTYSVYVVNGDGLSCTNASVTYTATNDNNSDNGGGSDSYAPSPKAASSTLDRSFSIAVNSDYGQWPLQIIRVNVTAPASVRDIPLRVSSIVPADELRIAPEPVAGYRQIEIIGLDRNLTPGTITFKVANDWIAAHHGTAEQVVMFRLVENRWAVLPTSFERSEGLWSSFHATTPGLSSFAVILRNVTPGPTITSTQVTGTPPITTRPIPILTPALPLDTGIPLFVVIACILAVIAVIVGIYLIRRWWIRRQNPALFEHNE